MRVRARNVDWCGVTATDDVITVFGREGRQFFASRCAATCSEPVRLPIESDRNGFLGFGCARDGCAIAYVDHDTHAKLGWFTLGGELLWTKPMGGTGFRQVSIANAGPRAVVASYGAPTATIFRVTPEGTTAVWNDPDRPFAPAVIWADSLLLLSHRSADLDDVTFEVMPLTP